MGDVACGADHARRQVSAECLLGFVLAVAGIVAWLVHPQDIHALRQLNKRPLEATLATPSYQLFSHRGQLATGAALGSRLAGSPRDAPPRPSSCRLIHISITSPHRRTPACAYH